MLQRESPETRQPLHCYRDVSSEHRQHPTAQTTATRIASFQFLAALTLASCSLGADFSYEMDFWGRVRSDALAAGAEYLASESDYQAARIGILAETIRTYFEIADTDRSDSRQRSRGDLGRTAERGSETLAARLAASRG